MSLNSGIVNPVFNRVFDHLIGLSLDQMSHVFASLSEALDVFNIQRAGRRRPGEDFECERCHYLSGSNDMAQKFLGWLLFIIAAIYYFSGRDDLAR
ncbi:MAG: hypothetical protein DHS20C03_09100 [Minwuia thermotolerans]|nr:MAG: hypothetical protein DHS20C03_09100 [Minwuia thermotolerans]